MAELDDYARELLTGKGFAHLATFNADGAVQVNPVWIDLVDGRVLVNTAVGRVKHRNLERDRRVTVEISDPENPYSYVEIRGTAELSTDGAEEAIDALAKKYMDADTYPFRTETEQRINVWITPNRVVSSKR